MGIFRCRASASRDSLPTGGWREGLMNLKENKMANRKIIPYNPILKALARKLRKDMTFGEVLLWNELKDDKLWGFDFDR